MKQNLISGAMLIALVLVIIAVWLGIEKNEDKRQQELEAWASSNNQAVVQTTTTPTTIQTTAVESTTVQTTTQATTAQTTTQQNAVTENATTTTAVTTTEAAKSNKPESTKEIIDQYTLLVDKFKKEKPAYKKKEYQALPEEHRKFPDTVNAVLNLASGYMVSEEDCEELIREKGSADILNDMPIHGAEKGCALTNYDAVSWAKCEDNGDGTYTISFSLKEEVNAEPTPADTLVPVSAHGAVMQPMAIEGIKKEIDSITGSLPGITVNEFNLYYRECVFSCVYNPETDEVKSITHHIVIDIGADVKLFSADIVGSARLLNEMFIYDITW